MGIQLFRTPVLEDTTKRYSGIIKDEEGNALPGSSLDTCTLTLYEKESGDIINSRDGVNILNANGGTVDVSGNFAIVLGPGDNVLVRDDNEEWHVALIQFTYTNAQGSQGGKEEVHFKVTNLDKVT